SIATGADTRTADRVRGAQSTAVARAQGRKATGYRRLKELWPGVAEALAQTTARGVSAQVRADAAAKPEDDELPAAELQPIILDWMRRVPDGFSFVMAGCGTGKTHAARTIAAERADKAYVTDAQGVRAPPQSKTSMLVPTTLLS